MRKGLITEETLIFCIIGDMNARFGSSVRSIPSRSIDSNIQACTYPTISDDIPSPNDNAL